jgi:cyclopropane-fatty-acyl-phospholipid synthase
MERKDMRDNSSSTGSAVIQAGARNENLPATNPATNGAVAKAAWKVFGRRFEEFKKCADVPFRIDLWDGTHYCLGPEAEPVFRVVVNNKRGLSALRSLSEIQVCDSYLVGDLELEGDMLKLCDLRRLFRQGNPFLDFWRRLKPMMIGQQKEDKKAISEHYEYDDDFYLYFLDETRTYSQGVYESDDESLEIAMRRKLDFAIESCGLEPGMRVLDVGGGWGAFTEYAGKKGISVTSLTISDNSLRFINELIHKQSLPCQALMGNFLDHTSAEPYDAVVILGVIEHLPDYELVVRKLEKLVKPGGRAYLDGSADRSKFVHNTFMNRYIYPGNHCSLSIHDFLAEIQRSDLELLTVLNDRHSYYLTVKAWAEKVDATKEEIVQRWGRELYCKFRLYLWGVAHNFLTNQQQAYRVVLRNNPPR